MLPGGVQPANGSEIPPTRAPRHPHRNRESPHRARCPGGGTANKQRTNYKQTWMFVFFYPAGSAIPVGQPWNEGRRLCSSCATRTYWICWMCWFTGGTCTRPLKNIHIISNDDHHHVYAHRSNVYIHTYIYACMDTCLHSVYVYTHKCILQCIPSYVHMHAYMHA